VSEFWRDAKYNAITCLCRLQSSNPKEGVKPENYSPENGRKKSRGQQKGTTHARRSVVTATGPFLVLGRLLGGLASSMIDKICASICLKKSSW
jgi:hypothetical protein